MMLNIKLADRDQKDNEEVKDHKDQKEIKEKMLHKVHLDHKEFKDLKDLKDHKEHKEYQEMKDKLVAQVKTLATVHVQFAMEMEFLKDHTNNKCIKIISFIAITFLKHILFQKHTFKYISTIIFILNVTKIIFFF